MKKYAVVVLLLCFSPLLNAISWDDFQDGCKRFCIWSMKAALLGMTVGSGFAMVSQNKKAQALGIAALLTSCFATPFALARGGGSYADAGARALETTLAGGGVGALLTVLLNDKRQGFPLEDCFSIGLAGGAFAAQRHLTEDVLGW